MDPEEQTQNQIVDESIEKQAQPNSPQEQQNTNEPPNEVAQNRIIDEEQENPQAQHDTQQQTQGSNQEIKQSQAEPLSSNGEAIQDEGKDNAETAEQENNALPNSQTKVNEAQEIKQQSTLANGDQDNTDNVAITSPVSADHQQIENNNEMEQQNKKDEDLNEGSMEPEKQLEQTNKEQIQSPKENNKQDGQEDSIASPKDQDTQNCESQGNSNEQEGKIQDEEVQKNEGELKEKMDGDQVNDNSAKEASNEKSESQEQNNEQIQPEGSEKQQQQSDQAIIEENKVSTEVDSKMNSILETKQASPPQVQPVQKPEKKKKKAPVQHGFDYNTLQGSERVLEINAMTNGVEGPILRKFGNFIQETRERVYNEMLVTPKQNVLKKELEVYLDKLYANEVHKETKKKKIVFGAKLSIKKSELKEYRQEQIQRQYKYIRDSNECQLDLAQVRKELQSIRNRLGYHKYHNYHDN